MSRLRVGAGVDCLGIKMCLSTYHFQLHVTQVKEPQGVARAHCHLQIIVILLATHTHVLI